MIKRTLKQIAQAVNGLVADKYADIVIEGVTIDSRHVTEHALFIPFKGEHVDGHQYVQSALHKGAAASFWQSDVSNNDDLPLIVVEDSLKALQDLSRYYLNEVNPKVIAITGSNGKTTTKDMIYSILKPVFKVKKTQGNYNNEIGLPLTICQLDEETEISILEMGMSGFSEIEFLSLLAKPHVAIITNIGESHMEQLGSRAGIAKAKSEIIAGLRDLLIFDADEPLLNDLNSYNGEKVSVGFNANANRQIKVIDKKPTHTLFEVAGDTQFEVGIPGIHQARNAAYAITVARYLGLPDDVISENLKHLEMTGMRMELITGMNDSLIINDAYNASPTSMKAAIDTLDTMEGQKFIVLSDVLELGADNELYHREIGTYLKDKDITVLTTGPSAKFIYEEADTDNRFHFNTKDQVVDFLKDHLTNESIVLFKASRGMALETIIKEIKK